MYIYKYYFTYRKTLRNSTLLHGVATNLLSRKLLLKILVKIYILLDIRGGGGLQYMSSTGMFRCKYPLFCPDPPPPSDCVPLFMKKLR